MWFVFKLKPKYNPKAFLNTTYFMFYVTELIGMK